jgi:transcriptional regulator
MNADKLKRLEAAGWKKSNVKELLHLTDADVKYIETKLALTRQLKLLREKKGVTQVELARQMHTSQARIARIEAGDPSVTIDQMIRALFTLGATRRELARAI